jgi:hypothetical protein
MPFAMPADEHFVWRGRSNRPFIRSERVAVEPSRLSRIVGELHADRHLSEDSATALEQIVRTAYQQLAARDASDARAASERERR